MTAEKQEYENLIEPDIKLLKTLLDETGYLKPTQAQLDWLETYKEQMSPTQREMLDIE